MKTPRLALFDCDGTLADSEYAITAAMRSAFAETGHEPPSDRAMRETIGLSVPAAMHQLLPHASDAERATLANAYRDAYFQHRTHAGSTPEPLYDGILPLIDHLAAAGWQLGIATGKSQRGLLRLLDAHGLTDRFATLQTADFHPSKPNPAMVFAALDETMVAPGQCVVIGDTSFDMQMARASGARAIGVTWGYHTQQALRDAGADAIAQRPAELIGVITRLAGETA